MDGSRGVQKSRNKSVRRKLNYSVNENFSFLYYTRDREWLDSTRERRVIDTSNGYCRFSGRRTRSNEGRCSKNSITRYESVWQVLNRNYARAYERASMETDRRNVRRYRVYATGLLADWHGWCANVQYIFYRLLRMIGNYRCCRWATNNTGQKIVRFAAKRVRVHVEACVSFVDPPPNLDYSLLAVQRLHGPPLSTTRRCVNVT